MLRFIFLIVTIFLISGISTAQITVKSFESLPNDLDARVNAPIMDQNGEKCALIKVETTEKDFQFEAGSLGITKIENKTGEIWVYVPRGSKKLTIKHDKLGILRDYLYSEPIVSATVYVMKLTTAKVKVVIDPVEVVTDWMVFTSQPEGAALYLDETFIGNTPQSLKKPTGKYNYRMELPMYHNEAGIADFNAEEGKKTYTFEMKPAFGWADINTQPEQGANLLLNGEQANGKSPLKSEKLKSGKHKVTANIPMYKSITVEFDVKDNETTPVTINLEPNFAQVTISTEPIAKIYIDDVFKAESSFTGRLSPGLHTFEARLDKYISDKQQKETFAGTPLNLQLKPIPRLGNVDIITNPIEATVKLNGAEKGKTPVTLKNLLIGEYQLTLEKEKYGTINQTISITEGKTLTVNEKLPDGKEITINSTPAGATVIIDGAEVGKAPVNTTLSFGEHKIVLKNEQRQIENSILVNQTGQSSYNYGFNLKSSVGSELVFIKGGTFQMGSNSAEAGSDEKPLHSVSVSDFFMGKYEVTQKNWQAVMGNNPSSFKGDNLPVENIEWYDAIEFCNKLSQKKGLQPYYTIDRTIKDKNNLNKNNYDDRKWTIMFTGSNGYRLPTEAEWEYAARAGQEYKYAGSDYIDGVAWYEENSDKKTHAVGQKTPNAWGLYDMSGNVWEWCWDWYSSSYYAVSPSTNPAGAISGSYRVLRGGSWDYSAEYCRVGDRDYSLPYSSFHYGFRLCRTN